MVSLSCMLSLLTVHVNSLLPDINDEYDKQSVVTCKIINHNSDWPLSLNLSNEQMEECMREIQNVNSKLKVVANDVEINSTKQLFYIVQKSHTPNDTKCYVIDSNITSELPSVTVECITFDQLIDKNNITLWPEYLEWNTISNSSWNITSKTPTEKPTQWIRIVRVGLASFSIFLAVITVLFIMFLFVVLFKCIERFLLIKRMPMPQCVIIRYVAKENENVDKTQESERKSSAVHYRQKLSASKLLHLKNVRKMKEKYGYDLDH